MSSNRPTDNRPTDDRPTDDRRPPGSRAPEPARALDWRHPAGWPLRTRLAAAMIALLALVCLVVGVATELTLRGVLLQQVDDRLRAASVGPDDQLRDDGLREPPRGRNPRSPTGADPGFPATDDEDLRIPVGAPPGLLRASARPGQQPRGRVQSRSFDDTPPQQLPAAAARVLAGVPVNAPARTYDLGGELGDYRVIARTVNGRGRIRFTGVPMADTNAVLYRVAGLVTGVTVLALVAAGYAGALIVRRNLRPLDRMAATAGRVAELRLDRGEVALAERVPQQDTDPRTEVGQVGAALNRMLGHVAGALAARQASETQVRQFVADASHELRTPLAAIRGYAELTRRGRDTVPPDLAHVLRRVESEAERMTTLVEDMLLLARLDAGRPLAREPVDLVALAVDAVSDAHATGPEHHWRLDLPDEPVNVLGDPARLHQVLANLLTNARTHTAVGTTVTVGVGTAGRDAVLRVTDDGPGIPPALLPHIFERFARGDSSRSRAAGSTGLGLAIVHAVVSAHGGTVAVASAPGRTEFTVRLPPAGVSDDGRMDRPATGGYPDRRDPMVFMVYEAGAAAGDSAMKP